MDIILTPTMKLRWVDSKKANDKNNAVKFVNDIGWGWPDDVVLQQLFMDQNGKENWIDVPLSK